MTSEQMEELLMLRREFYAARDALAIAETAYRNYSLELAQQADCDADIGPNQMARAWTHDGHVVILQRNADRRNWPFLVVRLESGNDI